MKIFLIKLLLYMARWQLSTPAMSIVILWAKYMGVISNWKEVAIANLICAIPFFFLDKSIFVHLDKWIKNLTKEQNT